MHTTTLAASLLVLFALVVSATPARAETVNCTAITALPAVITVQGVYCFTGDLSTAMTVGDAISIQTNNVILDLNGFKLGGLAAGPGTAANGIRAIDRDNITIKNGTVRGFKRGILFNGGQGHVVEDIRADQNTFIAIDIHSTKSIVRNNQVVATGATVSGGNSNAIGILVTSGGDGARVLNNDVIDTVKQGTGTATGIAIEDLVGGLAVNNRITGADRGIDYRLGATGKFRDNITFDVATPYIGTGTDIGNNN